MAISSPNVIQGQNSLQQGARTLSEGISFIKERQDAKRERREDERRAVATDLIEKYGLPGAVRARPDLIWDYAQDFGIDVGPFYDESGNVRAEIFQQNEDGTIDTPGIPWNAQQQLQFNLDMANALREQPSGAPAHGEMQGTAATDGTDKETAPPARTGTRPAKPGGEQPVRTTTPQSEEAPVEPVRRAGGNNYGPGRLEDAGRDTFYNEAHRIVRSAGGINPGGGSVSNSELRTQLQALKKEYEAELGITLPNWPIEQLVEHRRDYDWLDQFKADHLQGVQFNSLDSLLENFTDTGATRRTREQASDRRSGETSYGPNANEFGRGTGSTRSFAPPDGPPSNQPSPAQTEERGRHPEEVEEPAPGDPTETPAGTRRIMQGGQPQYEGSLSFLNEQNPFGVGMNVSEQRVGGETREPEPVVRKEVSSAFDSTKISANVALGDVESMTTAMETANPAERQTLAAEIAREVEKAREYAPRTLSNADEALSALAELTALAEETNPVSPRGEARLRQAAQKLNQSVNRIGADVRAAKARATGEQRREGIQNWEAVREVYSQEHANRYVERLLELRAENPERFNLFFPRTAAEQNLIEQSDAETAVKRQEHARANAQLRSIGLNPRTLEPLAGKKNAQKYKNYVDAVTSNVIEQLEAAGLKNELTRAQINNIKKDIALKGIRADMLENMSGGEGDPTALINNITKLALGEWGDMTPGQRDAVNALLATIGGMLGVPIGLETRQPGFWERLNPLSKPGPETELRINPSLYNPGANPQTGTAPMPNQGTNAAEAFLNSQR